jgi:hypothetical protein
MKLPYFSSFLLIYSGFGSDPDQANSFGSGSGSGSASLIVTPFREMRETTCCWPARPRHLA